MSKLKKARDIFNREGKIVETEIEGNLIFVGDTHGDFEATRKVIDCYLEDNTLVFLGDYVDRGQNSQENINFLLDKKIKNPKSLILLQGNHEGFKYQKLSPAGFWRSINYKKREKYEETLGELPLVFSHENIIGLHGSLPQVNSMQEIAEIQYGDENWKKIVWGDLTEENKSRSSFGRPQFGSRYFQQVMSKINKKLLVRSHQPSAPLYMFNKKCITIFTSSAYSEKRRIAIFNGRNEAKLEQV